MNRRWLGALSLLVLGLSGCWWDDLTTGSGVVTANRNANVPPLEKLPTAQSDIATRVDSLGKEILAANPEIIRSLVMSDAASRQAAGATPDYFAFKPQFVAIGVPGLALYHQRGEQVQIVVISAGIVKACKTDSELAAVLCSELAQMVTEAQAQNQPGLHDRPGSVNAGGLPEQATPEKNNPHRDVTKIDPKLLARSFLGNLGQQNPGHPINADDLMKVEPLVRQGNSNPDFRGVILTSGAPPAQIGFGSPIGSDANQQR